MPNLRLEPKTNLSTFRKIAIGTWQTVGDPTVYGMVQLRADKMVAYLDRFKAAGKRLTVTHVMAKAVAMVLHEMPDANAILRWNRIYVRKDIGVFFQVALEDEKTGQLDLSGTTIYGAHEKTLDAIALEFDECVARVRARKDKALEKSRGMMSRLPLFLVRPVLNFIALLTYTFNLDLSFAGIPKDPFGSAMVTNVGSLGPDEAYVPLVPYSRVPLLVAVGAIRDEPVVEGGEVIVAKVLRLYATFDHRVLDGSHAAKMCKTLRRIFDDPEAELGPSPSS